MKGFNEGLFKKGETVGVALSGGEDSVCLLSLMKELSVGGFIKVVAVNVEHGIRGESSLKDTSFCKDLCERFSVPLKLYSVDAPATAKAKGLSLEEAARKLRYECFYDAVKSGFCDKIACAHHRDDNVETVLFNLFRGTTISGLRGMDEVSHDGVIVRPLLNASKQDITSYVKEKGLPFVTDETNADVKYTRNFIRNEVLPLIKSRFTAVDSAIERLSKSAKTDDRYLYSLAVKSLEFKDGCAYIPCCLEWPVFSRAAILALKGLGVKKDFDNGHIAALFLLSKNISGKKSDLLNGLYGVKEGDFIVIKKKKRKLDFNADFGLGIINAEDYIITVEKCDGYHPDGENYVDMDKIPANAIIRKRRTGDVFYKFGGGKVSLKKFLTDKKIPADKKDETYVVAAENLVYVIVGVEISALCKIDGTTTRPAKITIQRR